MMRDHVDRSDRSSRTRLLPGIQTYVSTQDIATAMGISTTRVWQLEVRALAKLRDAILRDPYLAAYIREKINPDV